MSIARCVGASADDEPESEQELEALLGAGASPDEPAAGGSDKSTKALAPVLLLAQKRVLRPGARARAVLDADEEQWQSAAAHGPAASSHEALAAAMTEGAEAWHRTLAEEWQPMSWWRVLHGVMLLLQLPPVVSFEEDAAELPTSPTATVASPSTVAGWDDTFEQVVSVRMDGTFASDVGNWRARARMREELLAQCEQLTGLACEADDNLRLSGMTIERNDRHYDRIVLEAAANSRQAHAAVEESRRQLWREFTTQLAELDDSSSASASNSPAAFAERFKRGAASTRASPNLNAMSVELSAVPGSPHSPPWLSPGGAPLPMQSGGTPTVADSPQARRSSCRMTETHAASLPTDTRSEAMAALESLASLVPSPTRRKQRNGAVAQLMQEFPEAALERRCEPLSDEQYAALATMINAGKCIYGHQMARLRWSATAAPAAALARHVCRVLLYPPKVPPAAWAIVAAAAAVDDSFAGLLGGGKELASDRGEGRGVAYDSGAWGGIAPAARLLRLCRCLIQHASVHRCLGVLLRRGANACATDSRGRTIFHAAVEPARPSLLAQLLAHGAQSLHESIDAVDCDGLSPAALAAASPSFASRACLKRLLEAGASLARSDAAGGGTLLHLAVEAGTNDQLRQLLSTAQFRQLLARDGACSPALSTSPPPGPSKQPLELTDAADVAGLTPLCVAVRRANHAALSLLLEHGASMLSVDARGWTPLHHATDVTDVESVRLLLRHTASDAERRAVLVASSGQGSESTDGAIFVAAAHEDSSVLLAMMAATPMLWSDEREAPLHEAMLRVAMEAPSEACCTVIMRQCLPLQCALLPLMERCVSMGRELLLPVVCEHASLGAEEPVASAEGDGHQTLLHRLCDMADEEDAATVAEDATAAMAARVGTPSAVDDLRVKLEAGHILSAREVAQLKGAANPAAADDVANRLGTGYVLSDEELAQLRGAADALTAAEEEAAVVLAAEQRARARIQAGRRGGALPKGARMLQALLDARSDVYLFAANGNGLTALGTATGDCAQMLFRATARSLRRSTISIVICRRERYVYEEYANELAASLRRSFPGINASVCSLVNMGPGEEGSPGSFEVLWEGDEWQTTRLLYSRLATGQLPLAQPVVQTILQYMLGPAALPSALVKLQTALLEVRDQKSGETRSGEDHLFFGAPTGSSVSMARRANGAKRRGMGMSGRARRHLPPLQVSHSSSDLWRSSIPRSSAVRGGAVGGIRRSMTSPWLLQPLERRAMPNPNRMAPLFDAFSEALETMDQGSAATVALATWMNAEESRRSEEAEALQRRAAVLRVGGARARYGSA
jgi:hypothetical protein